MTRAIRAFAVAVAVLLGATPLWAKPREVYIGFTTNVRGLLTTCDTCESMKWGGMSQKSTVLAGWRKTLPGPLVLLDAGNCTGFGYGAPHVQIMLKAMDACGYAAANVGDNEAAFGAAVLLSAAKGRQVKWISANLLDGSGKRIFPASMVIEAQGVKVGVVGILDPEAVGEGFQMAQGLRLADPVQSASSEISRLRKKCDVIVLLACAPPERMEALAKALPQVDLVAGGSRHPQIARPAVVGRTLMFQPGRYEVARVRMTAQKGRFAPSKWDAYPIMRTVARDVKVEAMIARSTKPASR
jgi:2',3'-cyclic-nucleotide 2'-phosphodiesterase (5'-nucleotidase family)